MTDAPDTTAMSDPTSGVGVIDKVAAVLTALEQGPRSLADLATATGMPRPTAHRLAVALEHHRLVTRDTRGRFMLGSRLGELAAAAAGDRLLAVGVPIVQRLRAETGESVQLFRRRGDRRVCVASADRPTGLRDSIPVGTSLTMYAGSAAQVLLAWEESALVERIAPRARFTPAVLTTVRKRGWAQSVGERESGVASVSAPVRAPNGRVVAALCLSGPSERLSRQPGRTLAAAVVAAANEITAGLR